MKITFVTTSSVPYGLATTNRLLSLAKGLKKNGVKVRIFIINPTESANNAKNLDYTGVHEGIAFEYLGKKSIKPRRKVFLAYYYFIGLVNLIFKLISIKIEQETDVLIFTNIPSVYLLLATSISRFRNFFVFQERNEYPFIFKTNNILRKLDNLLLQKVAIRNLDGMFLMTMELMSFFGSFVSKKAFLLHVPMTVDLDRFLVHNNSLLKFDYLCYAGYMWGDKDGLPILIDSFKLVLEKYPLLKLCLIGDISNKFEFDKLLLKVVKLDIRDSVVFVGEVERDIIPSYFQNAKLLLLSRPNNRQAKGGFPTKLGEYLATGIPTVVTRVGEIPEYLTDGLNAFVAEPDSALAFSDKIIEALSDYDNALKVGNNGRLVAESVFSCEVQGKRIIQFIQKNYLQ
jgi:glycosyltransferase involved in cell wall biosynthesis